MIKQYYKEIVNPATGRKRKTKFWYAKGKITIDGKRIDYYKAGFTSDEAARSYENNLIIKARADINNEITYEDLFNLYLEDYQKDGKLRTYQDFQQLYDNRIKEYFGNMKISAITNAKIRIWQQSLLETTKKDGTHFSNSYLDKIQSLFKMPLNYGLKHGFIDKNINFEKIKFRSEKKKEMKFYSPEEFNSFIDAADTLKYKAFFLTLYFCGLRKGEALALTWNDIDFKNKCIKIEKTYDSRNRIVTTPKTNNSYRTVLIPERCLEALKELKYYYKIKSKDMDRFVFGYFAPFGLTPLELANKNYAQKANLKKIRIHDFRHSHVTYLLSQGISAFAIAKQIGDTPEMVNNTYGHLLKESKELIVSAFNNI
ncbi:site-specific integrase [Dielma fastidiosa]|uniref:Site-specific recombinase XerD n=1 Tax=Dielma fastidiosa TaxID=1034346 RepID=A0A318KKG9_9FIRM|nr:site-specific integrase [Dielma fastidiosa]PXX75301.1 site-specific recombinase XerD [Dielma fastidiosa]